MIKIERIETMKHFRNEICLNSFMTHIISDEKLLELADKLNEYINKYNLRK